MEWTSSPGTVTPLTLPEGQQMFQSWLALPQQSTALTVNPLDSGSGPIHSGLKRRLANLDVLVGAVEVYSFTVTHTVCSQVKNNKVLHLGSVVYFYFLIYLILRFAGLLTCCLFYYILEMLCSNFKNYTYIYRIYYMMYCYWLNSPNK